MADKMGALAILIQESFGIAARLRWRGRMRWDGQAYYDTKTEAGPFCGGCFDGKGKRVQMVARSSGHECPVCNFHIYPESKLTVIDDPAFTDL